MQHKQVQMKLTKNFLEQALVDQYNMYHLNIEY